MTNKTFKQITEIKKEIDKDSYIKYLEKIIKINLKYQKKLNVIIKKSFKK